MSWKKFFSEVPVQGATDGTYSAMGGAATGKPGPAKTNYSSYLPDVYSGAPNRIERYGQYNVCLLYTSPSPRDKRQSRMPSSA